MKSKQIIRKIGLFILAAITAFALIVNIDLEYVIIDKSNANMFAYAFISFIIYIMYSKYYNKDNKNHPAFIFLSILFSAFITIGYSFNKVDSWDLCFSSLPFVIITIAKIIGYSFLFNMIMHMIDKYIKDNKNKDIKPTKRLKQILEEHPFKMSLAIILLCWLPYIISFYPAILSPDPSFQIKQFFGIETKYLDYSVNYENPSTITNHHPVLHTVLLGGCTKLGHILFNSTNFGLFLYSIIQISILSCTLAFTIYYMKKLKTPFWLRLTALLIYALVPSFPLYSMSAVKDVIFTALVILYMIGVFDLIKNKKEKIRIKNVILMSILCLFLMLMRNNGIYLVLMSMPFLLLLNKKNIIKILIILIIPVALYKGYTNIVLPYFRITEGSIREMLSIPFQQTARYVKYYSDELDNDEIKAIDKVLNIKTLGKRYNPGLSDPVKNEYNKYTTDEELSEYFKMWFKGFTKRPGVYIEATLNNIYGYLTPNTANWYVYYKYDKRLSQEGDTFNYHYNGLETPRLVLSSFAQAFPYIPLVGLIVNIGFSVWVYMFMFMSLIKEKKFRYLIAITPMISLWLVCLASPANTYFRYAMPYVFALPIMIAIYLYIRNERSDKNE